jgi:hypothetical protein
MLSLLRLPSFPLQRDENSRNPALTGGATLISPILFMSQDRACSLHVAPARSKGCVPDQLALQRRGFVTEPSFRLACGATST